MSDEDSQIIVERCDGRTTLVTGAAGFIGSHLVERLVREGARVRAFVHYNARGDRANLELIPPDVLAEVDVVFGDLRDPWNVRSAVAGQEVNFHLGALISIPYSYQAAADYVSTNIGGTLNVLQAARDEGVRKVVQTSTSEVYGTAETVPISERHRLYAQSPYAASQVGADQLAQSFHLSFGVPVATIRPFNCYGPRQSARALVPTIATQLLFADTLRLGSLDPRRDLTFVNDTVDAFHRVGFVPESVGQTFNIGTGEATSVAELVELLAKVVGVEPEIEQEQRRIRPENSEVRELVADSSRAVEIVGWKPSTSLGDGLQQVVDWIRDHEGVYRPADYAV